MDVEEGLEGLLGLKGGYHRDLGCPLLDLAGLGPYASLMQLSQGSASQQAPQNASHSSWL